MRKKRLFTLIAILGLFIFVLFVLFRGLPTYNVGPITATNVKNPYIDGGNVYFYTGHGFAKYKAGEKKSTTLSRFMSFPQILHMDISSKNAIYQTAETYPTDSLYYYLKSRGLPTDRLYWWVTEFDSGETSIIAEREGFSNEVVSVARSGEDLLVGRQDNSYSLANKFELYRLSGDKLKLIDTKSGETLEQIIWADESKAIFSSKKTGQNEVSLSLIDLNTNRVDGLPEEVGGANLVANRDGNLLLYQVSGRGEIITDETSEEGLYVYKLGTEKPKLLIKDFAGSVTTDASGGFLVSGSTSNDDPFIAVVNSGGELKKFGLKTEDENKIPILSALSPLDQNLNKIVAVDDQENLYILSKDEEVSGGPESVPAQAREISTSVYDIAYLESSNEFSILIKQDPFRQNVELALKDLKGAGIDTNQHKIVANPVRSLKPIR